MRPGLNAKACPAHRLIKSPEPAGSLIAFNAYMVLLEKASSGLASSYTYVNPVIAMLLGVWLAGEVVAPLEWAAVAVILSGVVLLLIARKA